MSPPVTNNDQIHPVGDTQASELKGVLEAYDKEITELFGQALTIYAGPAANSANEKKKLFGGAFLVKMATKWQHVKFTGSIACVFRCQPAM